MNARYTKVFEHFGSFGKNVTDVKDRFIDEG
jgi:hypothetical protein